MVGLSTVAENPSIQRVELWIRNASGRTGYGRISRAKGRLDGSMPTVVSCRSHIKPVACCGDSKPVSRVSHSRVRVQVRRAVWQCMGPAVKTAHRYRICPQLSTLQIAHANHTPRVLSRHRAVVVESCACASMSECATSDGRRAKANRHQSSVW